ncbi:MAG: DUF4337 domain-containing protein [Rhizobacter sp.]
MSEGGIHVHGPHDHVLEQAATHGAGDSFSGRIAVLTAILATLGAMMSYQAGATQAEAMMRKNESAIKKTEAANQWSFYQAKGQKQNLSELGAQLTTNADQAARFSDQSKRYQLEKTEIKLQAEAFEEKSKADDEASELAMHHHHRWAQGTMLIQVAIALSAIALLTRKTWLQWGVYGVGTVALGVGAAALFGV